MAKVSIIGVSTAGGVINGPGITGWETPDGVIAAVGDSVQGHGKAPHNAPVMVEGSAWLTIDGIPVVVEGCAASCGHTATGESWLDIPK